MDTFIKYKRIVEYLKEDKIQEFLDQLIKDGWEIINYNETPPEVLNDNLKLTVMAGKKRENNFL